MFKKIIVGVDANPNALDAITLARQLATADTELVLAHVHHGFASDLKGYNQFELAQRRQSEALLLRLTAETGIEQTRSVGATSVGRGLHDLVEHDAGDLLVLGSWNTARGDHVAVRDELHSSLTGSTCAVAVAPARYFQTAPALRSIGVAFDGSDESQVALDVGRELATLHQASLSVCRVLTEPPLKDSGVSEEDAGSLRDATLDEAILELSGLGDVEVHVSYGDAAATLITFSRSVALLVVGSRGYGPRGRLIYGSTTLQLAHGSRSPLLIVPRPQHGRRKHARRTDTVITVPSAQP